MSNKIPKWQQEYLQYEPVETSTKVKKAHNFRTIPINGVPIQFPFQPSQIQLMAKIVQALKKSENALLESPTGSGKSLAILCGALAWREYKSNELRKKTELKYEASLKQAELKYEVSLKQAEINQDVYLKQEEINQENMDDYSKKLQILRQLTEQDRYYKKNKKKSSSNHSSKKLLIPIINLDADDDDDFQPVPVSKRRKTKLSTQTINTNTNNTNNTNNNNTDNTNNQIDMVSHTNAYKSTLVEKPNYIIIDDDTYRNSSNDTSNYFQIKTYNHTNYNVNNNNDNEIDQTIKEEYIEKKTIIENIIESPPPIPSSLTLKESSASAMTETTENLTNDSTSSNEEKIPKIYVCSRTHKQIEQLIHELRDYTNYRPRMTILGSREQMCVHEKISKGPNISDKCMELLDNERCYYGNGTKKFLSHDKFRPNSGKVWDIEEVVKLGKAMGGCPYYATRGLFEQAELVFCPYNYVIDPIIRDIMEIKVKDNIVIFDEAHNIEDIAREVGSFEVTEVDLINLQKELDLVIRGGNLVEDHDIMLFVINVLLEWVVEPNNTFIIKEYEKHIHVWSGSEITHKLEELRINSTTLNTTIIPAFKRVKSHADEIRKNSERISQDEKEALSNTFVIDDNTTQHLPECITIWALRHLEALFMIFNFLFKEDDNRAQDYSMALIKKIHRPSNFERDASWVFKLGFWCHNPGVIFQELSSSAHSLILTSGTLSPLDTFATELETNFSSNVEANHVIHPSQVWISSIPVGPNGVTLKGVYSSLESFQYQDDIGESIFSIINAVPFGVLCFLPSYSTLHKLINRWKSTGIYDQMESKKKIFIEPQGDNKAKFKAMLKKFYKTIEEVEDDYMFTNDGNTGALFFAVYRGKISEGIDFTDNNCRTVIAVGIPYPSIKDSKISLKKKYNDDKKRQYPYRKIISGNDWYTIQGFRAINQALGRCIRHKNDWGAIILLEERFIEPRNLNGLSKWIRKLCKIQDKGFGVAMEDLNKFIQNRLDIERGLNVSIDS
ncbi:unnamed protein product [Cunninghamella echinulata]